MLFLVTGASGVGKSTVRRILEPQVAPEVECVELAEVSPHSPVRDLAWRQRVVELCVQHAVRLQREGRHLLLCGDPVAAVEVIAAPSAGELADCAFCLLDATPQTQAARLAARGDDPALLIHHHAFAEWMRTQASDPLHMLEVVTTNGWPAMRWDRVPAAAADWAVHVIDTTDLTPTDTAASVLTWLRSTLAAPNHQPASGQHS
jgi:broad-specificity NMP kinase